MPTIDTVVHVIHDDGRAEELIIRANISTIRRAMASESGTVKDADGSIISTRTWQKATVVRKMDDRAHQAFVTWGNEEYARAMKIVESIIEDEPLCASANYLIQRVSANVPYKTAQTYIHAMINRKVIVKSDKTGKLGFPVIYEKGRKWMIDWDDCHKSGPTLIPISIKRN